VEGVIAERLARLDEQARRIITTAAVDGDEFTAEVVADACGLPERDVVRVLGGELERRHAIVTAQGSRRVGERRASLYRFRHNLFQRHLYDSLDSVERAYLHQDLAAALEAFHAADRDAVALRLARHHRGAGNALEAARYFHAAGLDAARRVATADAVEHQAAALAQLDEAGASASSAALRVDVLHALAEALVTMGRHAEAASHVEDALRLAADAPPLVRARLYRLLGASASAMQEGPKAMALLDRAEAELGELGEDSSPEAWYEWLQVQRDRAWTLYHQRGAVATLEALLRRIDGPLAAYGSAAQQRTFGECRILLQLRTERYRVSGATLELARQNVAAAEATGSARERVFAGFELGFCQLWAGAIDDAAETLADSLSAARRIDDAVVITLALTYLAFIARMRRDVALTARLAAELRAQAGHSSMRSYTAVARGHTAWCRLREGDTGAAIEEAREAVRLWEEELSVAYPLQWAARLPLLEALAASGDAAGAAVQARAILDPGQQPLVDAAAAALEQGLTAMDTGDATAACDAFELGARLAEGPPPIPSP
jgi:tetratricopeptide (TPR) repeat protein